MMIRSSVFMPPYDTIVNCLMSFRWFIWMRLRPMWHLIEARARLIHQVSYIKWSSPLQSGSMPWVWRWFISCILIPSFIMWCTVVCFCEWNQTPFLIQKDRIIDDHVEILNLNLKTGQVMLKPLSQSVNYPRRPRTKRKTKQTSSVVIRQASLSFFQPLGSGILIICECWTPCQSFKIRNSSGLNVLNGVGFDDKFILGGFTHDSGSVNILWAWESRLDIHGPIF